MSSVWLTELCYNPRSRIRLNNHILRIVRGISTTKINYQQSDLVKFKKLQADFQCEDGKPIWLKRGFCDRVLYSTTIVLCYIGLLMNFAFIYDNAKPESWKNRTC